MKHKTLNEISVSLNFKSIKYPVGVLAKKEKKIWFEYDSDFIKRELEISPFKLPLERGARSFSNPDFFDLFGVFADSLPDAWGILLQDRFFRREGLDLNEISALDRLALVGNSGFGALVYEPINPNPPTENFSIKLAEIEKESQSLIQGKENICFEKLLILNASSGGARPKIAVKVSKDKKQIYSNTNFPKEKDLEDWIIKFPASSDESNIAEQEYEYNQQAKALGIEVAESFLFEEKNKKFFGVKRFDKVKNERLHLHSLSGLLHADYKIPSLDYEAFLKATLILTKNQAELIKAFKLACFNVFSHNRDDHGKNFSFLMNKEGKWSLSPAYDLTYSTGPGGEHSTSIMGEGKNPGKKDLLKLAENFDIPHPIEIIDEISNKTEKLRKRYQC